ncbi:MAG TPA: hypothetical protein DEB24_04260 [Coriobacteriia bacterium]|nr:hypothetical protein [Coriobacteriia bacterium]
MNEQTGVPYGARQNPQYNPQPNYGYGQQSNQYAPQPQYAQQGYQARSAGFGSPQKDKWVATLLALFPPLGMFGIHKFYLGYKTEGLIMLLVAVLGTCVAFGPLVMTVIAIIEGVRYVTLTQEDFEATYVRGSKGWL